jgi:hypothetical protein
MTRISKITFVAAALVASMATFPAAAQDETTRAPAVTGSRIDPNAKPVMLPTILAGGAIEAARAVPLDANEARVDRPQIGEVDAAEWLPAAPNANK